MPSRSHPRRPRCQPPLIPIPSTEELLPPRRRSSLPALSSSTTTNPSSVQSHFQDIVHHSTGHIIASWKTILRPKTTTYYWRFCWFCCQHTGNCAFCVKRESWNVSNLTIHATFTSCSYKNKKKKGKKSRRKFTNS